MEENRAALVQTMAQAATAGASGAQPATGQSSEQIMNMLSNLLERVAVTGNNAAGSEGELAPADLDPAFLPALHVFLGAKLHNTGLIQNIFDPLLTGETALMQTLLRSLIGQPRADSDPGPQLAPGGFGFIVSDDGTQTVKKATGTVRTTPRQYVLNNGMQTLISFLRAIASLNCGVFLHSHPLHAKVQLHLDIYVGVILFLRQMMASLQENGATFEEAYVATLFYHTAFFRNPFQHAESELMTKLADLSRKGTGEQAYHARVLALNYNDGSFLVRAKQHIEAQKAPEPKADRKQKKARERDARVGPSRSTCALCNGTACGGYYAPDFLCTETIVNACRCGRVHARSGPRKTPCAPAATAAGNNE